MRADGLCGCITCDAEYPARVAFSLLTKVMMIGWMDGWIDEWIDGMDG